MSKVLHISCSNCPKKECIFCNSLDVASLEKLEQVKNTIRYNKGQYIYYESTPPVGVYCIYEGKVKVIKQSPDGKEQIVYLAKSGDILGTKDLITLNQHSTSACTIEDSVICHIPKVVFFEMIENNHLLYGKINAHLCRVLGHIEEKVLNFSQRNVRERLAINILNLNESFGVSRNNEIVIDVPLSREDMANMVGTATETVIRILSEFRKEGLVDFSGKKMTITNIGNLRKVAAC